RSETAGDPSADGSAVPAEVEDRREEETEGDQPEADQLMVLLALRLALLLLDPRGQAWAERALLLAARHGAHLRRGPSASYPLPRGRRAVRRLCAPTLCRLRTSIRTPVSDTGGRCALLSRGQPC